MAGDIEQIEVDPGAAKKRTSQKKAIVKAELYAARNLAKYIKLLEALANGVTVMKTNKQGEPEVYVTPPDRAALEYLIDRGMGRTPQRFEITGEDGGALEIVPWAPAPEGKYDELPKVEVKELEQGR